jgi:hypothetical protein
LAGFRRLAPRRRGRAAMCSKDPHLHSLRTLSNRQI